MNLCFRFVLSFLRKYLYCYFRLVVSCFILILGMIVRYWYLIVDWMIYYVLFLDCKNGFKFSEMGYWDVVIYDKGIV